MKRIVCSAVVLQCITFLTPSPLVAVNIEMVTVGNPGNAPDTRYDASGVGSVGCAYQIGKYEVTVGQYLEFLNAVAKDDPHGLYGFQMSYNPDGFGTVIQRSGVSPNYSYTTTADWVDRPVNWVSFWDAARFVNWLHNGQPIGAQGPGTTEDGAYHDVGNDTLFGRNAEAKYFLPTENEWYKAAYHDNLAGLAANYFEYPTGTNALPGKDPTETTNPGNNANFQATIGPYPRTVVGEFELSDSPYGTFDQGGNVWEMTETKLGTYRVARGGAFSGPSFWMRASQFLGRVPTNPLGESGDFGFRIAGVAPVPESDCMTLFAFAAVMLGGSRIRER